MRHILVHSILCFACMLGIENNLPAQELGTDTLWLDVFKIEAERISEVYLVDSIPSSLLSESITLVDALRAAGTHYVREYGMGNIANISMRGGSAQHSALYWNGIPVNSPSLGQTDLSLIPSIFIGEVAIFQGASSQLSGSGGLGGSLLLNSSKKKIKKFRLHHSISPALAGFGTEASLDYHSEKWKGRTAIHFLQAENAFDYVDDSGRDEIAKVRQNNEVDIQGIAQDISCQLSHRASLSLNTYYIHAVREIPANIGLPDQEDTQKDKIGRGAIRYERISSRWKHTVLLGDSEEWQQYIAPLSGVDSRIRTRASNLRGSSSFILSDNTTLRGQLNYDALRLRLDGEQQRSSTIGGLYLEAEQKVGLQTKVNFGIRYNQVDGKQRPLTASIGVRHSIKSVDGLSVKASMSKNHRDPTLNDRFWPVLGVPDLKAEEGYSSDLSMNWDKGVTQVVIGGFYGRLDELIVWLPSSDGRFRPVNVSESESIGIESKLTVRPYSWLCIRASYAFTDSRIIRRSGEEEQRNIYQPGHRGHASVEFQNERHRLGSSFSYTSPVRVDFLEMGRDLHSIHLWNVSYRWIPRAVPEISIGLNAINLLNHNYEYISRRPIAGRHLQFHLIITINEKP